MRNQDFSPFYQCPGDRPRKSPPSAPVSNRWRAPLIFLFWAGAVIIVVLVISSEGYTPSTSRRPAQAMPHAEAKYAQKITPAPDQPQLLPQNKIAMAAPLPDNIRSISVGGKRVNIPVPNGYTVAADILLDPSGAKTHLFYELNYPGQGIRTFISIGTMEALDSIYFDADQFAISKNFVRATEPVFSEREKAISFYKSGGMKNDAIPMHDYQAISVIHVNGAVIYAVFTAVTDHPDSKFPEWVRQSAVSWRDAILAANGE